MPVVSARSSSRLPRGLHGGVLHLPHRTYVRGLQHRDPVSVRSASHVREVQTVRVGPTVQLVDRKSRQRQPAHSFATPTLPVRQSLVASLGVV